MTNQINLTEKNGVLFKNGIAIATDPQICENMTLNDVLFCPHRGPKNKIKISLKEASRFSNILNDFLKIENTLKECKSGYHLYHLSEFFGQMLYDMDWDGPVYERAYYKSLDETLENNGLSRLKNKIYEEAISMMNKYIHQWRYANHSTRYNMENLGFLPKNQKGRYFNVFSVE